MLPSRSLGRTGLAVSCVGLGGGALGELDATAADRLVGRALDLGVTLFDTARSYGPSEDHLGAALASRASRAIVVTKGGYGADGAADWTPDAIARGVEGARRRLRRDAVDVFLLHSCPRGTLEGSGVVEALVREREAGRVRFAGYSGEGDALAWAAERPEIFDVLECSLGVFDRANEALARAAAERGQGVLAKRPLSNAPWRFAERPERGDVATYWDRMRALGLDPAPLAWDELAVRFAAHAPGVASILVGTASEGHLARAVEGVGRGPLPVEIAARVRGAWEARCGGAPGVI